MKQSPKSSQVAAGSAKRPSRKKGEETRRRLLEAAESVFAALGYHDASIVKITELAGVAQGTFYLYFDSKHQIFEEVVADLNHRVRRAMSEASKDAPNRLEAERRGFAAFFHFTAEHPSLYRVMRQAEFVAPEAVRQHYERIIAGYRPPLERAMASGEIAETDPVVLAWTLSALGEAIGMRWILWGGADELPPEVFEEMMKIIGRILGNGKATAAAGDGVPQKRRRKAAATTSANGKAHR